MEEEVIERRKTRKWGPRYGVGPLFMHDTGIAVRESLLGQHKTH